MNRALIITTGIVIVLLVLGLWIYLMLFGTPKEGGEVFTNLGFELGTQNTTITPPSNTQPFDTLVNTQSGNTLRQLTTRPVAGFAFVPGTTTQSVRYIEKGTGHMYEINLETGQENILSRTTIPQVSTAVFSSSTNTVSLTSFDGYQSNVFVGTLGDKGNLLGISLQPGASNIAFSSNSEVLYTITSDTPAQTTGYTHNTETLAQSELFSVQYKNFDVTWGGKLDAVYLSTKPSKEFEGFVYIVKNNILTPVTPSEYGLSTLISKETVIRTYLENDTYVSDVVKNNTEVKSLPIIALKEKCTFDAFSDLFIWCASPIQVTSDSFVEDWYKGVVVSDDYLWLINTNDQTAQLYANPEELTGRSLDMQGMQTDIQGGYLSFTNKKDNTLWLYDLSIN